MSTLSILALSAGAAHALAGAALWARPAEARRALAAFPRHAGAAGVLSAAALLWVAWVVYHASLGRFDYLKPGLWVATPLAWLLIVGLMDELLAPRALGGLLLLLANPLLHAARFQASPWSLGVTVLAYAWVVLGIAWVLGPHRFRRWTEPLVREDGRARRLAAALAAAGLLLAGPALTVF